MISKWEYVEAFVANTVSGCLSRMLDWTRAFYDFAFEVHRLLHQFLLPRILLSIRLKPATAPCPTPQAVNKLASTTIDMHVSVVFVALARSSPILAGSLALTGFKKFCPVCYCYTHGDFLLGSRIEQPETIFKHLKCNDRQEACHSRCAALAFGSRDVSEFWRRGVCKKSKT